MIFLQILLICGVAIQIFASPDLSHAIARISEARARAVANRARLRANTARITNHLRSPSNSRSKRQYEEEYPNLPPAYEEPELVHICSVEDDEPYLARSAEDSNFSEETSHESFNNPNMQIFDETAREANDEEQTSDENDSLFRLLKMLRAGRIDDENAERDADALHSHFHSHQHSVLHGHGKIPYQSHILTPGLHIPSTQVVTPGLNLNINQNQGLHSTPFINHGVSPLTHGSVISSQTQSIQSGHLKEAEAQFNRRPIHHASNFNNFQHNQNVRPFNQNQNFNPSFNRVNPSRGFNQNFQSRSDEEVEDEDFDREANPTIKKLKRKKMQFLQQYGAAPQYPVNNFGYSRDAEYDEEMPTFGVKEASPTIKKLKRKKMQLFQEYPHYGQQQYYKSGPYRENDFLDRESNPTQERNEYSDLYKRALHEDVDSVLQLQRQIIDILNDKSENEDMNLIKDIGNRTLTTVQERHKKIVKRSIPLTRLISDPSVKLDVPKTIENFGTATKSAFEDERAPMYHLRHLVGSSKNALLSAMRIPPQNMIIPSDYQIVRSSERGDSSQEIEDDEFSHTFQKVGQMLRNSIKSGQETVAHIGEAAHSARNVLNTARHSAPRLIIPYSQIPALQNTRSGKKPNKAILITPRLVDLTHETSLRKASDSKPNFVRLGHLMDAVGISNPNSRNLELQKLIFEPRRVSEAKVDERLSELYSKIRNHHEDDVDTVSEALSTLEDAKLSVGAKNLRDFLIKMKNELTNFIQSKPEKKKVHKHKKKSQEKKEMGRFIETLFDGSREEPKNEEVIIIEKNPKENEAVGLNLPPELMHPFMNRASQNDLQNFLHEEEKNIVKSNSHFEHLKGLNSTNRSDLGYVLGAINPLMFERLYNQTVEVNNNNAATNPEEMFGGKTEEPANSTVGSFALNGAMLKPFMGQVRPQQVENFLDTYNDDEDVDYEEVDN